MLFPLLLSAATAGTWDVEHQVAVAWFPKGARYALEAEYRMPASWQSDSPLFDDVFFAPGVIAEVTPAYTRIGGSVHFSPIAVLDIKAQALATGYYGTFSGVTDFDSADADYSEAAFDTDEVIARKHAGIGFHYGVTPTLRAKVSHLIVALPQEFTRFTVLRPDKASGDFWYEPQYDALMGWNDTVMVNTALAFWAFRESTDDDPRFVWAGLRFDHSLVFGTDVRQVKFGPMLVLKPGRSDLSPKLVFFAQAWLESRIHPRFPPYLALALLW